MNYQAFSYELKEAGYLQVSGEDRQAFLQRQTTNDIRLLEPGKVLLTVLTSPTARILDVFYLLPEPDSTGVITLPGYATATARFLRSRIFFMDKVVLTDSSAELTQVEIFGPEATAALGRLGIEIIPDADQVQTVNFSGLELRLLHLHPSIGLGYRFLVRSWQRQELMDLLLGSGFQQVSEQEYRLLHVEAGIPFAGAELVEAYTPLEAGLASAVSGDKGCYTGQEVIARQITYDKITQRIVGIQFERPAMPGDRLWADGKLVGLVTSAEQSKRFGMIGLAMLKRPHDLPGTQLDSENATGIRSPARVVALPFKPQS